MSFTFRPGTLLRLPLEKLSLELDRHLPRLYDAHNALNGIAIKAPAINGGFAVQGGSAIVLGSKLAIPTGLSQVSTVTASINNGAAPVNSWVTARPSQTVRGAIDIFVWSPTAAGNNTPIASTTNAEIHWYATGTGQANT